MTDYHPITVHFPIAFLAVYIVSEIIYTFYNKDFVNYLSFILLVTGVIGGIASVITGNIEYQILQSNPAITQSHFDIIDRHSDFATYTMWYFMGILIFRVFLLRIKNKSRIQYIFIIFVIIGGCLLYETAEIGGKLVYDYGIGTELMK